MNVMTTAPASPSTTDGHETLRRGSGIAVAAATRYSSLASLIASAAAPAILYFIGTPHEALTFLVLAIATFIMHRGNIARLWQGTEGKIGQKAEASRGA